MTNKIELQQGDIINWKSAAGDLQGTIVGIATAANAKHQLIEWLRVERMVPRRGAPGLIPQVTRLAYTANNMAMMKVELDTRYFCEDCGAAHPAEDRSPDGDIISACCADWIIDQDGNPKDMVA
jgi:hypothetical protein